jgi:hypothetical protein
MCGTAPLGNVAAERSCHPSFKRKSQESDTHAQPSYPRSNTAVLFPSISSTDWLTIVMSTSKVGLLAMPADSLSIIIVACLAPVSAYCLIKLTMGNGAKDPPAASCWFPLLSHTRTFSLGDTTLASTFLYALYYRSMKFSPNKSTENNAGRMYLSGSMVLGSTSSSSPAQV